MSSFDDIFSFSIFENPIKIVLLLSLVGLLTCLFYLLQFLSALYIYCFRKRKDIRGAYGDGWVLITGASDGIGKAYAFEFARIGYNIILVARNEEKTKTVANEIKQAHKIEAKVVVFDFNEKTEPEEYQKEFEEKLKDYDVAILVNNVGHVPFSAFHDLDNQTILNSINTDILPQVFITKIMVPRMLKRERRSAIITTGSLMVIKQFPFFSVSSGTKAFGHALSESLAKEYEAKIDTLVIATGSVQTKSNSLDPDFTTLTPETYVKNAIDKLGYERVSFGHFKHLMGAFFVTTWPLSVISDFFYQKYIKKFAEFRKGQKDEHSKKKD